MKPKARGKKFGRMIAGQLRKKTSTLSLGARIQKNRISRHLRAMDTRVENVRIPKPKISPRRIAQFWKDYDAGKRRSVNRHLGKEEWLRHATKHKCGVERKEPWFQQVGMWKREPVAVTPTVLGTVRNFRKEETLIDFLSRVKACNDRFKSAKTFDFQPTHVLSVDAEKLRLLEHVFRAPAIHNILERDRNALYQDALYNRLHRKQVDFEEFFEAVRRAHNEILQHVDIQTFHLEPFGVNLLVLDYNPKTKKPLIAFVDQGSSIAL